MTAADHHPSTSVRPLVSDADYFGFFKVRCDVENIITSGHQTPPSWTGLRKWVDSEHDTGSRLIFVIWRGEDPVGYVYAIRRDFGIETVIEINLPYRGEGIGRRALLQLPDQIGKIDGWPPPYIAWIKPANLASFRVHEAAGFRPDMPEQERILDGVEWRRRVWSS